MSMKSIETEILIEASRSKVWQTLMDFNNYGTWNPFIKKISGSAQAGDFMDVTIQMKEGSVMDFKPEVLKTEVHQEFRWKGKVFVTGLFDGEHYFILENQGDGKTLFKHGECFTGLLQGPLFAMISDDTRKGFESMNQALKEVCEGINGEDVGNAG